MVWLSSGTGSTHLRRTISQEQIIMKKRYIVAAISTLFYSSLCLAQAPSKPAPNILFIISDDHGWGDLPSNWDKTEVQMPRLDALANGGTRFTNYHTVPLCAPSRACLFTGQFTSENGMWRGPGGIPGEPGYKGIKRDVKMLSEYLSDAGYATGGFGKWHMGAQAGDQLYINVTSILTSFIISGQSSFFSDTYSINQGGARYGSIIYRML